MSNSFDRVQCTFKYLDQTKKNHLITELSELLSTLRYLFIWIIFCRFSYPTTTEKMFQHIADFRVNLLFLSFTGMRFMLLHFFLFRFCFRHFILRLQFSYRTLVWLLNITFFNVIEGFPRICHIYLTMTTIFKQNGTISTSKFCICYCFSSFFLPL